MVGPVRVEAFRWLLDFHASSTQKGEHHSRHSVLGIGAAPAVDSNAGALAALVLFLLALAGWVTHLVWTISVMLDGPSAWQAVLAVTGVLLLPVGGFHGVLLWL